MFFDVVLGVSGEGKGKAFDLLAVFVFVVNFEVFKRILF